MASVKTYIGNIKGPKGDKGDPGYTPVKGKDYFDGAPGKDGKDYVLTKADKTEIAEQAAKLVEVPEPEGTGIEVTAKPGQLIRVKEVDENGNPTAWEAAEDMPWAEGGRVEVLAETTLTEENFMEVLSAIPPLGLVVGNTYVVNISGVEYTCVAETNEDFGFPVTLLLTGGMPFFVAEVPTEHAPQVGTNVMIEVMTEDAKLPATLSIYADGEVVHPLDTKYLPGGVPYVEKGYLLEETDAVETTDPTYGKVWVITTEPNMHLTAGKTYTVIYNGMPYDCVCQAGEDSGLGLVKGSFVMGNFAVAGGENTGEPFAMLIYPANQMIASLDLMGAAAVRIGIWGDVVHKLDNECLDTSYIKSAIGFGDVFNFDLWMFGVDNIGFWSNNTTVDTSKLIELTENIKKASKVKVFFSHSVTDTSTAQYNGWVANWEINGELYVETLIPIYRSSGIFMCYIGINPEGGYIETRVVKVALAT